MLHRLRRSAAACGRVLSVAAVALAVFHAATGSVGVRAQGNYYRSVDTSSPSRLRSTLHATIDDHTRIPYTSRSRDTWDVLESAMEDFNNSSRIVEIYRNESHAKRGGGNSNYEREHSWPKSYGFPVDVPDNYPYTDCHALFLCDPAYNAARSNKPFRTCSAQCQEFVTVVNNGRGGGRGTYPGNSNWTSGNFSTGTWEVWRGRRGDLARAMFYMDVRYEGGRHGGTNAAEPDLILTDNAGLIRTSSSNASVGYMGLLSTLLAWHAEDPVDAIERRKNDRVFAAQGNRNPFVDHPEWVDCLYRNRCGQTAAWQSFGSGCPGSAGTPVLGQYLNVRPVVGSTFVMLLSSLPSQGALSAWIGGSRSRWNTTGLPLDLGVIGMPGCDLLAAPSVPLAVQNRGGVAVWSLPIPNSSQLVGGRFYAQALVLDPGANSFGAVTTNGGEAIIGSR